MSAKRLLIIVLIITFIVGYICAIKCHADPIVPEAPAFFSWLPHGYGATMHVNNAPAGRMEGLHGFRTAPQHIGSWSYPLWGWDVNGYFRGPQVPQPDPVMCQLPIGLIYPANGPMPPPPSRDPRSAHVIKK
jgi:hypothetical protein